jgi:gliding motility-associated-like protein
MSYRVLIKVYSGSNCVSEYHQDITVFAAPDVRFDPIPGICEEVPSITLTQAYDFYGNAGIGTYSGNGIATSPVLVPLSAGPGLHLIQYLFVANNGCRDSATQSIQVYPTPILDLGPDRNVLEGDQITLSPLVATGNGLSYLWDPGTYLSSITAASPVCTPLNDITYQLDVVSTDGCRNSGDIFIKVVKDFIVPNTFTPNGDGINDKWLIENLSLYPNHRVQVFNRYGQVLYDSKNYLTPWDGSFKGSPLPAGTYYYIIDLGGARSVKKGYVTLIK